MARTRVETVVVHSGKEPVTLPDLSDSTRVISTIWLALQACAGYALYRASGSAWDEALWFGALGLLVFGGPAIWFSRTWSPRRSRVRIVQDGTLHFGIPSRVYTVPALALALTLGYVGVVGVLVFSGSIPGEPLRTSRLTLIIGGIGLILLSAGASMAFLAVLTWQLPAGASLTLFGVSARTPFSWKASPWAEIDDVTVELGSQRYVYLVLHRRDGRPIRVSAQSLGSDPNVVAAIIQFYLQHPQHRDALAEPEVAMKRFEGAV